MNPHIRIITDLVTVAMLFILCAMLVYQQDRLYKSRHRENEMFVLANRLDVALADQEAAALQWRAGALSCFGRVRDYRHLFDATASPLPPPNPWSPGQLPSSRALDAFGIPR